jgi:hypothetical protein
MLADVYFILANILFAKDVTNLVMLKVALSNSFWLFIYFLLANILFVKDLTNSVMLIVALSNSSGCLFYTCKHTFGDGLTPSRHLTGGSLLRNTLAGFTSPKNDLSKVPVTNFYILANISLIKA